MLMRKRTIILTHGDTDGVTSAAIVKSVYKNARVFFTHPSGLLEDLVEFTQHAERVIICDIALNEPHLRNILDIFRKFGEKLTYVDHHPLPLETKILKNTGIIIVHEEKACAAELAFRFFKPPWDLSRVALYGSIGDYALDTPFVRSALYKWDIKTLFLEAGILILGLEYYRKDYDFKRFIVEKLSENVLPSCIHELVTASIIEAGKIEDMRKRLPSLIKTFGNLAYVINPKGSLGIAAFYAHVISGKKVGLAIEARKDTYVISLRSNDPRINLNYALRKIALKTSCSCGGHPHAAGARIPKEFFKEFLQLLNEEINKQCGKV